jgi:hypothetical protein
MNLPFSPTFFRKIDLFQQLMEYENLKDKKHLWAGVKALLMWAASEHHQHIGSSINKDHVKDALNYCVEEKFLASSEGERMMDSARHILESLITYEFGTVYDNSNPKNPQVKLNRNGILAGQILVETKNLISTDRYQKWSFDWYLLYWSAGLLLFFQVIKALIEIIKEIRNLWNI